MKDQEILITGNPVLALYEKQIQDLTKEVEFLRYFYDQAGYAFGPADSDIYEGIAQSYPGELPREYDPDNDDDLSQVWT